MAMVQTALAICEPINMESMRTVVLTEISRHFSAQVYGFYTFDKHNNKFVGKVSSISLPGLLNTRFLNIAMLHASTCRHVPFKRLSVDCV